MDLRQCAVTQYFSLRSAVRQYSLARELQFVLILNALISIGWGKISCCLVGIVFARLTVRGWALIMILNEPNQRGTNFKRQGRKLSNSFVAFTVPIYQEYITGSWGIREINVVVYGIFNVTNKSCLWAWCRICSQNPRPKQLFLF